MLRFYSAFNLQPLARLCRHCAAIYCIDFDFLSNLKRPSYGIWSEFPIHKPNHTVVTHSDTVFAVVGSRNISFRVHDVVKRVLAVSVESFPSASPTTCDYFFTLSLYKVVLHHLHQSHWVFERLQKRTVLGHGWAAATQPGVKVSSVNLQRGRGA